MKTIILFLFLLFSASIFAQSSLLTLFSSDAIDPYGEELYTQWDGRSLNTSVEGSTLHINDQPNFSVFITIPDFLTPSKTYHIVFEIADYQHGDMRVVIGGATLMTLRSGNGVYAEDVLCPAGGALDIYAWDGALTFDADLLSLSIKEVLNP